MQVGWRPARHKCAKHSPRTRRYPHRLSSRGITRRIQMLHRHVFAAALTVFLAAGCSGGGGGSSASSTSTITALIQDAPLVTVNGHTFNAVNVTITAFEARHPRNGTWIPFTVIPTG